MPLLETRGAASAKGFGLTASTTAATYIEDVFATTLFTGNGGTQTITTGVDLSTFGGLIWGKQRLPSSQSAWHELTDTARGFGSTRRLSSNATNAGMTGDVTGVTTSGVTLGIVSGNLNTQDWQSVLWTFRKQPKFFDVVTYTGNGANRTISHNLGSVPGCIMVKRTDTTGDWSVYHRSLANTQMLNLNTNTGIVSAGARWNNTTPTATEFSIGTPSDVNANGGSFVAYLFAHDAGGFGLTGTDNVISCGSFVCSNTSGFVTVNLGWEPQWILFKKTTSGGPNETINDDWFLADNMRGLTVSSSDVRPLHPNLSATEGSQGWTPIRITATGFQANASIDQQDTFIYIAIRRGPMKTPTTGTSVFTPITKTGDAPTATFSEIGFQPDIAFNSVVGGTYAASTYSNKLSSRLTGLGSSASPVMETSSIISETSYSYTRWNGSVFSVGNGWSSSKFIWYFLRRAPSFADVVCWLGTGTSSLVLSHNLGVIPELIIIKQRNSSSSWFTATLNNGVVDKTLALNLSNASGLSQAVSGATATTFTAIDASFGNPSNTLVMAYLFASCPGVSKVGSYTGNGSSQTINCGFTGGARFVLIKRTNAVGDWVVFDSARGIVAGNDPFLELNTTAAEQTGEDAVDADSTGFIVNQTTENLNASGGTYIFLAIA